MFLTSLLGASHVHKVLRTIGIDSHWGAAEGPEIRKYTRFIFQKDHSTKNVEFGLEKYEPRDRKANLKDHFPHDPAFPFLYLSEKNS